jgi:hypothetical protein
LFEFNGHTMLKQCFHDYDNLQLLSKYSHVIIFGLQTLSLFWLQPLLGLHDYKYDYM